MPQCKVPLDPSKPDINLCISEAGHEDSHYTYGLGWAHITYSQRVGPREYANERGKALSAGIKALNEKLMRP